MRAALERGDLREPLEAVLGGDVRRLERRRTQAVHAREVDDPSEPAFVHAGQRRADEQEGRLEHQAQDEREPLGLELLDGAHVLDAGVVHEDVGVEREVGERRGVAEVDLPGLAADLACDPLGRLAVQVGDHDVGAAAANARAHASPMPLAPPVTTARRPLRSVTIPPSGVRRCSPFARARVARGLRR